MNAQAPASIARPDDDHYPTPREAVYPLVRHLVFPKRIAEVACGEGHISKVLAEYGYQVESSNLVDRGYGKTGVDFLKMKKRPAPALITNPPFSLDEEFVMHALSLRFEICAFLLRLKWLCGAARYRRILGPTPPVMVLPFIERITFYAGDTPTEDQPGWSNEDFAWFIWRPGFVGHPIIDWLSRDDGMQADLFRPQVYA